MKIIKTILINTGAIVLLGFAAWFILNLLRNTEVIVSDPCGKWNDRGIYSPCK